jgi:hypothetical protein
MKYENALLKINYGKPDLGLNNFGITKMIHKPSGINYGFALDLYGCGYAKYDSIGPTSFKVLKNNVDTLEIEVKYSNCVNVTKIERLFKDKPILEIEYKNIEVLWVEDYFDNPDTSVVWQVLGVNQVITRNDWKNFRKTAEDSCGHNFGDCFLKAAGANPEEINYKGYFIFGVYSPASGNGIGEVIPYQKNMHDCWKPWWDDRKIPNYECFPMENHSYKRWIFLFEGGAASLYKLGKNIADNH